MFLLLPIKLIKHLCLIGKQRNIIELKRWKLFKYNVSIDTVIWVLKSLNIFILMQKATFYQTFINQEIVSNAHTPNY